MWLVRVQPKDATRFLSSQIDGILDAFRAAGDERGLARGHYAAAEMAWLSSQAGETAHHGALAFEHAVAAGDEALRSRAALFGAVPFLYGDAHVDAGRQKLAALRTADHGPMEAAMFSMADGLIADIEGRLDDARAAVRHGVLALDELGISALAGAGYQGLGQTELAFGNPELAQEALTRGVEILSAHGEHSYRATTLALLAEAEQRLGHTEAAQRAIESSEGLSADEDIVNFAITHGARALLALDDGDLDGAQRWARSALGYADRTDFYWCRAKARLQLSRVLSARGQLDEAITNAQTALAIYERKGDRPRTATTREWLVRLQPTAPAG